MKAKWTSRPRKNVVILTRTINGKEARIYHRVAEAMMDAFVYDKGKLLWECRQSLTNKSYAKRACVERMTR